MPPVHQLHTHQSNSDYCLLCSLTIILKKIHFLNIDETPSSIDSDNIHWLRRMFGETEIAALENSHFSTGSFDTLLKHFCSAHRLPLERMPRNLDPTASCNWLTSMLKLGGGVVMAMHSNLVERIRANEWRSHWNHNIRRSNYPGISSYSYHAMAAVAVEADDETNTERVVLIDPEMDRSNCVFSVPCCEFCEVLSDVMGFANTVYAWAVLPGEGLPHDQ